MVSFFLSGQGVNLFIRGHRSHQSATVKSMVFTPHTGHTGKVDFMVKHCSIYQLKRQIDLSACIKVKTKYLKNARSHLKFQEIMIYLEWHAYQNMPTIRGWDICSILRDIYWQRDTNLEKYSVILQPLALFVIDVGTFCCNITVI